MSAFPNRSNDLSVVNPQIIDGVASTAAHVIGESPAFAMAALYQAAAGSAARLLQNNAGSQQAMHQINVAVVSTAIMRMLAAQSPTPPPPPPPPPGPKPV